MNITINVLENTGFIEGCEGCRYMQAGMDEQREHSEKCRQRIEEELAKTEEGQRIINAQENRKQAREEEEAQEKDVEEEDSDVRLCADARMFVFYDFRHCKLGSA